MGTRPTLLWLSMCGCRHFRSASTVRNTLIDVEGSFSTAVRKVRVKMRGCVTMARAAHVARGLKSIVAAGGQPEWLKLAKLGGSGAMKSQRFLEQFMRRVSSC